LKENGGSYTIGDVNTRVDYAVDTSNDKDKNYIHNVFDCEEGDVFMFTGTTSDPTVCLFAVLDDSNTILYRGESARGYRNETTYINSTIIIPNGGKKFICNHLVVKDKEVLYCKKN
jgi:hypothetical protein